MPKSNAGIIGPPQAAVHQPRVTAVSRHLPAGIIGPPQVTDLVGPLVGTGVMVAMRLGLCCVDVGYLGFCRSDWIVFPDTRW
jgi:hypothetical protein